MHIQSLNDSGSAFWAGRAWVRCFRFEWYFGACARGFSIFASLGGGDSDADLTLHLGMPFLFSFYFTIQNVYRAKEWKTGIAIHGDAFWFYPATYVNESRSDDPWWREAHVWDFPWAWRHSKTEILDHDLMPVCVEPRGECGKIDGKWWLQREVAKRLGVTSTWPYKYKLKKGEIQERQATIFVTRYTWLARWYPLIWRKKVRTSIDVQFDGEIGEKTGSWKGGCIGCGYDMLPGESPFECLCRMERERTF